LASAVGFNANDLFGVADATYLLLSPSGQVSTPGGPRFAGYSGCDVFTVNPSSGTLAEAHGKPVVQRRLVAADALFSGACTYAVGANQMGYVISILGGPPRLFRIYATGVAAP
jgi:hypothetical protein